MAAPTDEFRELLVGEGDIDVERLRELARYGIPDEVRGETWKLLLTYTKSRIFFFIFSLPFRDRAD